MEVDSEAKDKDTINNASEAKDNITPNEENNVKNSTPKETEELNGGDIQDTNGDQQPTKQLDEAMELEDNSTNVNDDQKDEKHFEPNKSEQEEATSAKTTPKKEQESKTRRSSRKRKQTVHYGNMTGDNDHQPPPEKRLKQPSEKSSRVVPTGRIEKVLFELCQEQDEEYRKMFRQVVWAKFPAYPWTTAIVAPPYLSGFKDRKSKLAIRDALLEKNTSSHVVYWLGANPAYSRVNVKHIKPFTAENTEIYSKGVNSKKITAAQRKDIETAVAHAEKVNKGEVQVLEAEPTFDMSEKHVRKHKSATIEVRDVPIGDVPGVIRKRALDVVNAYIEQMPLSDHVEPVARKIKKKRKRERKEKKNKKKSKHKKKDKKREPRIDASGEELAIEVMPKVNPMKPKKVAKGKSPAKKKAGGKTKKISVPANETTAERILRLRDIVKLNAATGKSFDKEKVLKTLTKLGKIDMTIELLKSTKISNFVSDLRKHENDDVKAIAKRVRKIWMKKVAIASKVATKEQPDSNNEKKRENVVAKEKVEARTTENNKADTLEEGKKDGTKDEKKGGGKEDAAKEIVKGNEKEDAAKEEVEGNEKEDAA